MLRNPCQAFADAVGYDRRVFPTSGPASLLRIAHTPSKNTRRALALLVRHLVMAEQSDETPSVTSSESNGRARSATDNLRQLTEASKQLFEAGKQITESLSQLSQRVEHASDVSSQVLTSPWLIAAGAVVAGTAIIMLSRRR